MATPFQQVEGENIYFTNKTSKMPRRERTYLELNKYGIH